jgi:class 3 adenylate cyclase
MPRAKKAKPEEAPVLRVGGALFADIVAFSKLSTGEQPQVLDEFHQALQACETFKKASAAKETILTNIGDGFGVVFTQSPVEALKCAEELSQQLAGLTFKVRMGIHIGAYEQAHDVEGRPNAAGELLNTASRAMTCANPGHIVITRQAADIARELPEFASRIRHAGHATVKHGVDLDLYQLEEKEGAPTSPEARLERWFPLAGKIRGRALRRKKTSEVASVREIAERLVGIGQDAKVALVIVAMAVLIHIWAQITVPGKKIQLWAYEQLEGAIPTPDQKQLPVTVVDFGSGLQNNDAAGSTNMNQLASLIDAVAKYHPAAIGVDVDFSELSDQTFPPGEIDVVQTAEKWTDSNPSVPIYLVIGRALPHTPDSWLGDPKYEHLVAHAVVPLETLTGQITLIDKLSLPHGSVPSMADQLANALLKEHPRVPLSRHFFNPYASADMVTLSNGPQAPASLGKRYYVNFAALPKLETDTLHVSNASQLNAIPNVSDRITGCAVLIGSTAVDSNNEVPDQWIEPGTGQPKAGVYLLALGAYTKAVAPLYELTGWLRNLTIIVFSFAIVSCVMVVRLLTLTSPEPIGESRVAAFFTIVLTVVTLAAGIVLVRTTGVLWTDFFLVALVLMLHPRIEHVLIHGWAWLRKSITKGWNNIAFNDRKIH